MKKLTIYALVALFSAPAFAKAKIEFGSLIQEGLESKEKLSKNVEVLLEGAANNQEEKQVLEFIAEELKLEKAAKIAEQAKRKSSKKSY